MSKTAESTVQKRKPTPAEKQECHEVFAEMYSKATTVGLSPDEYQVLDYVASSSITTIRDLRCRHPWLSSPAGLVRSLTKRLMLRERAHSVALTSIGWIYLAAARTILYPNPAAKPEVAVALRPGPQIEGRVILTPNCAYSPLCSGVPALDGVLVTFVSGPDPDPGLSVGLEHRNYCCELHAAFDLLRTAADGMDGLYEDEGTLHENLGHMARRSLNGEPLLGDQVSQSHIDSVVDRILGSGDQV